VMLKTNPISLQTVLNVGGRSLHSRSILVSNDSSAKRSTASFSSASGGGLMAGIGWSSGTEVVRLRLLDWTGDTQEPSLMVRGSIEADKVRCMMALLDNHRRQTNS
jgi:hypothetical protein